MRFSGKNDGLSVDLCGAWQYAFSFDAPEDEIASRSDWAKVGLAARQAGVPGNFELDLFVSGLEGDPFYAMNPLDYVKYERAYVYYSRAFKAELHPGLTPELVFEGLDCFADVYVNGVLVGSADNMLIEQRFNVDHALKRGENEIMVAIRPAVLEAMKYEYPAFVSAFTHSYESLYVRKAPHMYGWDIMPRFVSAGIWRPVRIQYTAKERLRELYLDTLSVDLNAGSARLLLHFQAELQDFRKSAYHLTVEGVCGENRFYQRHKMQFCAGTLEFSLDDARFWFCRGRGEAALYQVTARLFKDGEEIDHCRFTHGVRTVELIRTSLSFPNEKGEFLFKVNGEPVFIKGSNWVPVDAFHSRDRERIPRIMEMTDELNINMLRCWGGNVYEDDLFYRICDEKGILVWQDFAMACAVYPQDERMRQAIEREAKSVLRRLRQHPCIALWSGDNECDMAYARGWSRHSGDPKQNVLTRVVLPEAVRMLDGARPYIGSSPFIDGEAYRYPDSFLTEHHPWGVRNWYKSDYYKNLQCHFASEFGYHGCPNPVSLPKFLSPDNVWPYWDNPEWILHCTAPVPEDGLFNYRVQLMEDQILELLDQRPDNLQDYALASQFVQAEAFKYMIEFFRGQKWERTGLLWWNLIDGWPQFSDAIVDYYFEKKLAYYVIARAQAPVSLMFREPDGWRQNLIADNDTREDKRVIFSVIDMDSGETCLKGEAVAKADAVTELGSLAFRSGDKRCYLIKWEGDCSGQNHYIAGFPPFTLEQVRGWYDRLGLPTKRP